MRVIRSKIRPPSLPSTLVSRPRLTRLLRELEERFLVVWVIGTAGAGKTTVVADAVGELSRPVVWLSLDSTETAPGRLLLHLQSALAQARPDLSSVAIDALASDIPHVEAAGLLADALGDEEITLVIDELERFVKADDALATLSAFLRYAPPSLHVILISRREITLRLGSLRDAGNIGWLTEIDLAFDADEAASALAAAGREETDATEAVEATGGWVAGVLFEAWRSPRHVPGSGGEVDPLSGYLSSEIMRALSEEEQEFLATTSLLDEVTARRAEALGLVDAGAMLASLVSHRLPVLFSPNGLGMRCHARFREYLQRRLLSRDAATIRELHDAHAVLLASEGRHDDAVEEYLLAENRAAAEQLAEEALPLVLRRRDLAIAERWLGEFSDEAIASSETLAYAYLLVLIEREQWSKAAAAADRLLALTRAGSTDTLRPHLAGAIGTCYLYDTRIADAFEVLALATPSHEADAWGFVLAVDLLEDPRTYRDRPDDCGTAVDGFLARTDLAQGRFARLIEPRATPWAAAQLSRIAALRAVGHLDDALALLQESSFGGESITRIRIHGELMADLDRRGDAYACAARGREILAASGALTTMLHLLFEAMLALRFDRDTGLAEELLARVESDPTAHRRLRILEQLETWRGLIGLIEGRDAEAAQHLRAATGYMTDWDRLLFLPTAAVYLAEAEWRLGDEDAADAAADLALTAAEHQGSSHLLVRALAEFPAVVSRRLDAEADADSAWHVIGRSLLSGRPLASGVIPRVHVREWGMPAILVDGQTTQPKLTKSVEVLAYLAAHRRATKYELLDALFEGRTDESARSYLRQALNRLREVLPQDAPLLTDGQAIEWANEYLTSDSIELEHQLQQAMLLRGADRVEATLSALGDHGPGEYLPDAKSAWADARREDLLALTVDARLAAAEAALDTGDLARADRLSHEVLRQDPFRESAWRLSMRAAAAMGHGDLVITRYRACETALAEVSTQPTASTRRLLDQLRR